MFGGLDDPGPEGARGIEAALLQLRDSLDEKGPAIVASSPLLGQRLGEPGPGEAHDIEASSPLVFGGLDDPGPEGARGIVAALLQLRDSLDETGPAITATSPLLGQRLGEPEPGEAHNVTATPPRGLKGLGDLGPVAICCF